MYLRECKTALNLVTIAVYGIRTYFTDYYPSQPVSY